MRKYEIESVYMNFWSGKEREKFGEKIIKSTKN